MRRKDKSYSAVQNAKQPSWKKFFSKKRGKTSSDAKASKKSGIEISDIVGNSVDETRKNSSDVEDIVTLNDPQIDATLSKANMEADVVSLAVVLCSSLCHTVKPIRLYAYTHH
jgi:hypothetical protein